MIYFVKQRLIYWWFYSLKASQTSFARAPNEWKNEEQIMSVNRSIASTEALFTGLHPGFLLNQQLLYQFCCFLNPGDVLGIVFLDVDAKLLLGAHHDLHLKPQVMPSAAMGRYAVQKTWMDMIQMSYNTMFSESAPKKESLMSCSSHALATRRTTTTTKKSWKDVEEPRQDDTMQQMWKRQASLEIIPFVCITHGHQAVEIISNVKFMVNKKYRI